MKKWTLPAAARVLLAWPGRTGGRFAQRAPQPAAAGDMITFDQYRDFRARDLQQRQARLARHLADPGVSLRRRRASSAASLLRRVAAMPAEERDQLYRERFDQIDSNHDGKLDPEERAALAREAAGILPPAIRRTRRPGRPPTLIGGSFRSSIEPTIRAPPVSSATSELTLVAVAF